MPPKGKAKAKAYKLADIDAEGITVRDLFKKEWKVGKVIGTGGFGRLYQATDISNGTGSNYVIKIEPSENGPLFSELSFYQRKAKEDAVKSWMADHKLKKLGVPLYKSSGLHEIAEAKYRFMIIPMFGKDLQKILEESNKRLPLETVLKIVLQVLDVLEYLHCNDYAHADIKASNLLLGLNDPHQVYLLDYGLAYKYRDDKGKHVEYKEDPKKAHNGTKEFTSRDAHKGCSPSCRGDLEILGYCMLQWLYSRLLWDSSMSDQQVSQHKHEFMDSPSSSVDALCKGERVPACVKDYLELISKLAYDEKPDYGKLRSIIRGGLKNEGFKDDGKLSFPAAANKRKSAIGEPSSTPKRQKKTVGSPKKSAKKVGSQTDSANEVLGTPIKQTTKRKASANGSKVTPSKSPGCGRKVTKILPNKNNSAIMHAISPMSAAALKKAKIASATRKVRATKAKKMNADPGK